MYVSTDRNDTHACVRVRWARAMPSPRTERTHCTPLSSSRIQSETEINYTHTIFCIQNARCTACRVYQQQQRQRRHQPTLDVSFSRDETRNTLNRSRISCCVRGECTLMPHSDHSSSSSSTNGQHRETQSPPIITIIYVFCYRRRCRRFFSECLCVRRTYNRTYKSKWKSLSNTRWNKIIGPTVQPTSLNSESNFVIVELKCSSTTGRESLIARAIQTIIYFLNPESEKSIAISRILSHIDAQRDCDRWLFPFPSI